LSKKKDRGVAKAIKCVEKCLDDTSKLAYCFIDCYLGYSISEAYSWVRELEFMSKKVMELYGFKKILYSREFRSFIEDPFKHLGKKLFIYTHDFLRGKLKLEEYAEKSMQAINTSLRTNMRSLYQNWCILALLFKIYSRGAVVVYPEHNVLSLERSGKQKLRWIPPNIIIDVSGYGSLSFYVEAPRPLAWGDTSDLRETWKLYTALRPDLMIYGGRVYDIVKLDSTPPVKKPDLIIEFKELPDWYKRVRDVKGPLAKPLSAEEWRTRWIEGLWDGLADVLGVSRGEAIERLGERRGVRLTEAKVVELYYSVYRPDEMFLISKHKVPPEVAEELASYNIIVVDNIGFNPEKLEYVVVEILKYAKPPREYVIKTNDEELAKILFAIKRLWEERVINKNKVLDLIKNSIKGEVETSI